MRPVLASNQQQWLRELFAAAGQATLHHPTPQTYDNSACGCGIFKAAVLALNPASQLTSTLCWGLFLQSTALKYLQDQSRTEVRALTALPQTSCSSIGAWHRSSFLIVSLASGHAARGCPVLAAPRVVQLQLLLEQVRSVPQCFAVQPH